MNLNDLLAQGQRELEELREKERIEAEQRRQAELAAEEEKRQAWVAVVMDALPVETWPYVVVPLYPQIADRINVALDTDEDFFPMAAQLHWKYGYDDTGDDEGHLVLDSFMVPWRSRNTDNFVYDHGDVFRTASFPLALAVAKERWEQWNEKEAQDE